MTDTEDKICFVIGPIGSAGSRERKDADAIFEHMIKPIVEPQGFRPVRADMISEPGLVSRQVMRSIIHSPLVIADLTDRNPNVYYELAVRHAIRKPLVQLINGKPPLPFDVVDTRTIFFDITDLASVEDAKGELQDQVQAVISNPKPMENPIAEALDLDSYRTSGDSSQVALGQVLEALSDVRGDLRALQAKTAPNAWTPILTTYGTPRVWEPLANKFVATTGAAPPDPVQIPLEYRAHMTDPHTGKHILVDARTLNSDVDAPPPPPSADSGSV